VTACEPKLVFVDEADEPAHVFISYAHENSAQVDRLQRALQTAGVPVWRDKAKLWPGDDWRAVIRRAIRNDTLAFIACFSQESVARAHSFHNEELALAIEEMQRRPQSTSWLIPVRLSNCAIPDIDIGGGRTLRSLHWADLFGPAADDGTDRLVTAVRRILGQGAGAASDTETAPSEPRRLQERPPSRSDTPSREREPGAAIAARPLRLTLIVSLLAAVIAASAYIALTHKNTNGRPGSHAQPTQQSGHLGSGATLPETAWKTLKEPGDAPIVESVAFGPGGTTLATGDLDASAYIWELATGKVILKLADPGHQGVDSIAFDPDGMSLASGHVKGRTYLWDLVTGKVTEPFQDLRSQGLSSVAFGPDGTNLATADMNGAIYLWDIASDTINARLQDPDEHGVASVAFNPRGTILAAGDYNGCVYLWDVAKQGRDVQYCPAAGQSVESVAFSPNGQNLAAGEANSHVYVWNLATRKRTGTFRVQEHQAVETVTFSPGGRTLAAGDYNGRIYLWDLTRRKLTAKISVPGAPIIESVAFAPNGTTLAAGTSNGLTYLWTIRNPAN
jgi:hypothetical protein